MPRNEKDRCPKGMDCDKSIHDEPEHFSGDPADDVSILRCVLYEMYVLAISVEGMLWAGWPDELRDRHISLGEFGPREALQVAALIKFRTLYDFLYLSKSGDDFTADNFKRFGVERVQAPTFSGFPDGPIFNKESVNKFVAHLTWARINKPQCIPQPKFSGGRKAIFDDSLLLLESAEKLVDTVIAHVDFPALSEEAEGYLAMFRSSLNRLRSSDCTASTNSEC